MTNLYQILNVTPGASADEIRHSYRRLSKMYHPDLNPGNAAAEEKIKEINKAYDVLSDPAKRQTYDNLYRQFTAQPKVYHYPPNPGYSQQAEPRSAAGPPPNYGPFQYSDYEHPLERYFKKGLAVILLIFLASAVYLMECHRSSEIDVPLVTKEEFAGFNAQGDSTFNTVTYLADGNTEVVTIVNNSRTAWVNPASDLSETQLETWLLHRLNDSSALYGSCEDECFTMEDFQYTVQDGHLIIGSYFNGEYLQDSYIPLYDYKGLETVDGYLYILTKGLSIKEETYVTGSVKFKENTLLGTNRFTSNDFVNLLDIALQKLADSASKTNYPVYSKANNSKEQIAFNNGLLRSALEILSDSMYMIKIGGKPANLRAPQFKVEDNEIKITSGVDVFTLNICDYYLSAYNHQNPVYNIEFIGRKGKPAAVIYFMPETRQYNIRQVRKLFYACKIGC